MNAIRIRRSGSRGFAGAIDGNRWAWRWSPVLAFTEDRCGIIPWNVIHKRDEIAVNFWPVRFDFHGMFRRSQRQFGFGKARVAEHQVCK